MPVRVGELSNKLLRSLYRLYRTCERNYGGIQSRLKPEYAAVKKELARRSQLVVRRKTKRSY
jgi:hypothetical protein